MVERAIANRTAPNALGGSIPPLGSLAAGCCRPERGETRGSRGDGGQQYTIMSNDNKSTLTVVSENQRALAARLGEVTALATSTQECGNPFLAAFTQAGCIGMLREAFTPEVMGAFMSLQNTALGFRTDKAQGGYPEDVVKEAVIEASLRGLSPVGNQFNIISGRMYVTKEGFQYLLSKVPGLRYGLNLAVPVMKNGGAIVTASMRWQIGDGAQCSAEKDIPVRVNAGMGADAILGKATRKASAWLYNELTHAGIADGDAEGDAPLRAAVEPAAGFLSAPAASAPTAAPAPAPAAAPAQQGGFFGEEV